MNDFPERADIDPAIFNCAEGFRLRLLVERDGPEAAVAWAERTMHLYRQALLSRHHSAKKPHFATTAEYRVRYIRSYLHFKRFVLALRGRGLG